MVVWYQIKTEQVKYTYDAWDKWYEIWVEMYLIAGKGV